MRNDIQVAIGDKTFNVPEINPQKGCHWAKRLLGMGVGGDVMEAIGKLMDMPFNDFKELQGDFLSGVRLVQESGQRLIMDTHGNLLSGDVDGPELLELTTAALAYSMSPFFEKALGERIGKQLAPLFQKLGLTTSSTSPSEQNSGDSANSGTAPIPSAI